MQLIKSDYSRNHHRLFTYYAVYNLQKLNIKQPRTANQTCTSCIKKLHKKKKAKANRHFCLDKLIEME